MGHSWGSNCGIWHFAAKKFVDVVFYETTDRHLDARDITARSANDCSFAELVQFTVVECGTADEEL
jgi:hypothetical protein